MFVTQDYLLISIIGILLAGILFIFLVPTAYKNVIRDLAFKLSLIILILSILIWYKFDKTVAGFQFQYEINILSDYNLNFAIGLDGISMCFLLLTTFIMPLCLYGSWTIETNVKEFTLYLLMIELFLIVSFSAIDLLFFYVFFESVLIPMFIIIGCWGARERKIKAAFYFFLYTLFGSLFMLFGIIYIYTVLGTTHFNILLNTDFSAEQQLALWLCFFLPFAIKIPMFPFHIWLPEAHVEAPTIGSVILASLLLKLGSYGFLRFTLPMFPQANQYFNPIIYTLAVISIVYASLATIRQIDMKRIIAYSSVAHMNLMVVGLFSYTQEGIDGAIYLMLAHGIVSSALFFCVGVLYDRFHTRLLKYYSGLVQTMPIFAVLFLLFTMANMSFPGTSNFIGELLILVGIFAKSTFVMLFAATGIILSAVYSIWLYNRIIFGTLKIKYIMNYIDVNIYELYVLGLLTIMMLLLGVNSNIIFELTHFPVKYILVSVGY